MESWVWVLIGFIGGIIVYAILNLIFAKDPSDELEKLADERAAELAKAEMKTAVLQDKLVAAETARDEQQEKSEAECSERLREADAACQQKLAEANMEHQEQLAAAEANYRERLSAVEEQFSNLESTFAEKAAEIGAAFAAAGLSAQAAEPRAESTPTETEIEEEERLEGIGADDAFLESAVPVEALDAAMAVDIDDGGILEPTTKDEDQPFDAYEEFDAALAETEEGVAEVTAEEEFEEAVGVASLADEDADETSRRVEATMTAAAIALAADDAVDEEQEEIENETVSGEEEESAVIAEGEAEFDAGSSAELSEVEAGGAVPETFSAGADRDEPPWEEVEEADDDEDAFAEHSAAAMAAAAVAAVEAGKEAEANAELEEAPAEEESVTFDEDDAAPAAEMAPDEIESDEDERGTAEPLDEDYAAVDLTADNDAGLEEAAVTAAVVGVTGREELEADADQEVELVDKPNWPEDTSVWTGEYFNNMKLEGEPVLVREDPAIDFDWDMGSPAPEINNDGFSVRWTRTAEFAPGLYRFTVTSDDGARLWVNDRLVISAWYDHTEMTFRRELELPGGPVDLKLEYYENEMAALVRVSWERIG